MKKYVFIAEEDGRILKILQKRLQNLPFSAFSASLRKKDVAVDGVKIRENEVVNRGSEIVIFVPDNAVKRDFTIFYEDEKVLFINKNRGIEVCNGEYNIVGKLAEQNISVLPVHRLDRNTTGLVMLAKSEDALSAFKAALSKGKIVKNYIAEVYGKPSGKSGVFTDFMLKNAEKALVSVYDNPVKGAEKAVTKFEIIKSGGETTLLKVTISEGKTHQIRASLAHHGLPIIGDGKYGIEAINRKFHAKNQRLCAYSLKFEFDENSPLFYLNKMDVTLKNDEIIM